MSVIALALLGLASATRPGRAAAGPVRPAAVLVAPGFWGYVLGRIEAGLAALGLGGPGGGMHAGGGHAPAATPATSGGGSGSGASADQSPGTDPNG